MLDRIGKEQATFDIASFTFAGRPIHVLLNYRFVFRVVPLKNMFHSGLGGLVVSIDSKGFFRPEHLACGKSATEAAGLTQSLCFSQVGFTAFQISVEAGILQRNSRLRS